MFVKRLISGIVLVIIAVIFVSLGGWFLWGLCLALSIGGMFEMYRVLGVHKKAPAYVGYATVALYYVVVAMVGRLDESTYGFASIILGFLVIMTIYVARFPKYNTDDIMKAVFGIIYPGVLLSCTYLLRSLTQGNYLVWLIFLSSWGNDTCAYCVGIICKKIMKTHPMTPELSPKKTVEGLIGGLVGCTLLGLLYGNIFAEYMNVFKVSPAAACALLCFAGGVLSVIGDLAASAVKRNHDIKDYSNLIPGHGGIMDRFDSMTYSAPVLYFISLLLLAA
ncbi:MAG: phosphatidate cytidylyltransferase [Lachnospiraceae bacterium]|nr:phosphatidate cytidylyltransferase [Lachnospiraceae bacterium]